MLWLWPALFLLVLVAAGLLGLDQALLGPARSQAAGWVWITRLGDVVVRIAASLAVAGWLWWMRGRNEAALMAGAGAAGVVLPRLLKVLVDRPRPPDGLVDTFSASFPSGHAMGSMATFVTAALLLGGTRAAWVAAVAAVLVGYSRMALGVHYLSDVAAGWLLGLLVVVIVDALRSRTPAAPDAAQRRGAPPPGREPPAGP